MKRTAVKREVNQESNYITCFYSDGKRSKIEIIKDTVQPNTFSSKSSKFPHLKNGETIKN
jgi:hypothetical protein